MMYFVRFLWVDFVFNVLADKALDDFSGHWDVLVVIAVVSVISTCAWFVLLVHFLYFNPVQNIYLQCAMKCKTWSVQELETLENGMEFTSN